MINADDFGYSPGVTRGILEAHAAGTVTSTSIIANAPGFEDAARRAREAPALGIGVHLNLVQGRPLARVPSLVNRRTGEFLPIGALLARALARRVAPDEVAAECAAQIARVREAGIEPTHIDGHQHAHALPGIWPAVAAAARGAGIRVARAPLERPVAVRGDVGAMLKAAVVAAAWRAATSGAPPLAHADHFAGMSLQGKRDVLPRLLRLLDALPPGTTELMVHAGRVDATLASMDRYTWQRERELEALLSEPARARLARGDIQLVTFRAVA
ncbi:MAG TPA: ChbG/HpnK family deacetylase [Gemmatimonadaceae bacterium]|nr:ChbG/HpnK family deacetylase [Gemmatimonadaceae bacterium]